ncbi:ATP-binding protein [Schnuerera sp.]|uniref:ATP-binding protein n=1 Tax=Schnuerera sp. TaxID=2794844 RepID=UPI002C7BE895|nr:AAA family ATPase [Schnuerera sp.]HSH34894.1 AAA family ATPase [Schnuerera sp.]
MILKELNLISFGKFQKERFNLEKGLNILYGENESGKTTIHNFIDGMFYGFLKPYAKKRYYLEEYEKYKPWNANQYMGILKFLKDDKKYRIERNFNKGEVKVYDELTGEDITDKIDNGEKVKVHLPGLYFFDFNTTVYKNTISIKQLGNKIDSTLSTEVKDRLANISTSLDDEISVKHAISNLDKKLDKIGTDKAYTKPYGSSIVKLNKLKEKRKLALEKQKEYNNSIDEFNVLKDKIEYEEGKIQQLKDQIQKAKILEKKKKYEDILNLKEEIKTVDEEIEKLKPYSNLSLDDYEISLRLENHKDSLTREIKELLSKISSMELELSEFNIEKDNGTIRGLNPEELFRDMNIYNEMEDKKNKLILNNQQNRLEILKREFKMIEDKANKSKIKSNILILLTVIALGLILINPILAILALPFAGLYFVSRKSRGAILNEVDDLNRNIQKIALEEEKRKKELRGLEEEQKNLLIKYNCSSKLELNRLYDNIRLDQINKNQRFKTISQLEEDIEKSKLILKTKKKERESIIYKLENILHKNNSNNLNEFKEGLDKKRNYDSLLRDRKGKIEIIEKILGNTTLEELKMQLSIYDNEYFESMEMVDISEVKTQINIKEESLSIDRNICSRLEERIFNLNQEVKLLIDIGEEINRVKKEIQHYENKIKSIKIAKSTIDSISQEIHNQFAPRINREVSKLINYISGGKYEQVKVNDDLNIAIENPQTKAIIDVDSLSGGTIDQLYFALRFSVISSMKGDNLPLILDDCFIQYDDERLENILNFLGNMSQSKQILLFTCHHREKQILDKLGLKYNMINLS